MLKTPSHVPAVSVCMVSEDRFHVPDHFPLRGPFLGAYVHNIQRHRCVRVSANKTGIEHIDQGISCCECVVVSDLAQLLRKLCEKTVAAAAACVLVANVTVPSVLFAVHCCGRGQHLPPHHCHTPAACGSAEVSVDVSTSGACCKSGFAFLGGMQQPKVRDRNPNPTGYGSCLVRMTE